MILVIDNYDSFTYNLVQYLMELGASVDVVRNDAIGVDEIRDGAPDGILLSPGPGTPDDAGITLDVIAAFRSQIPILGVCLGHQSIAQSYGGRIVRAERLMHGRVSPIHHSSLGVFSNVPSPFTATRYHSLIVERSSLPDGLDITAWTQEGEIMGLRNAADDVEGVQFHPESFLTEHGHTLLRSFVERTQRRA